MSNKKKIYLLNFIKKLAVTEQRAAVVLFISFKRTTLHLCSTIIIIIVIIDFTFSQLVVKFSYKVMVMVGRNSRLHATQRAGVAVTRLEFHQPGFTKP